MNGAFFGASVLSFAAQKKRTVLIEGFEAFFFKE